MGILGKQKQKQQQPDISNAFSNELNRENAAPQPRGSKVLPGIVADEKATTKEPATDSSSTKGKRSKKYVASNQKADKTPPKRNSTAGLQSQSDSTDTTPARRNSDVPMKRQSMSTATTVAVSTEDAKKDEVEAEEDAEGLYKIFVQTRRCEELCSTLGLTMSDIRKMKRKYNENDMYHSGEITQAEFFFMINEEQRPLTMGIFKFANLPETQKFLSFDHYLLCVVNFASLTKPELYRFVFDLYDDDESGTLDQREFAKMCKELKSKQFHFSENVATAIKMLEGKEGRAGAAPDDGLVDLDEFMKFAKNFPVAFYPIMNMQKNVRASTLGESRWSRITANKLKVQELVSYMRRHHGAVPELTFLESVANIFSSEIFHIRKRAGDIYSRELAQRQHLTVEAD